MERRGLRLTLGAWELHSGWMGGASASRRIPMLPVAPPRKLSHWLALTMLSYAEVGVVGAYQLSLDPLSQEFCGLYYERRCRAAGKHPK